jgi:VanZ family protein
VPAVTAGTTEATARVTRDRHHLIKSWIAAILWLIVIAIESTTYLSAHNTSRFLYPLLHFAFGVDHARFEVWHHYLRKGGHIFGYGLLSVLLFRAWRDTLPDAGNLKWTLRWSNLAVLGTLIVASLDEWHQTYLPSRTGRWQDAVLDTSAGIACQVLLFLIRRY